MTASSDFASAQASLATQKDAWLGRLVWYNVPEKVAISHTQLVQHLVASNLQGFLPRIPSDIDKFRKTCTNAQQRKVPTTDPEVFDNYNLRELGRDPTNRNKVTRVLVRERVRSNKVEYEAELCRITFTAPSRSEEHGSLDIDAGTDPMGRVICDDIREKFKNARGTMDGYAIRELFRRAVESGAHGVNVRRTGGGLYFVSEDFGQTIDNLETLAGLIPEMLFHYLPMIDDAKQRELVRKAYESETVGAVGAYVNEIANLRASGKPITKDRVAGYMKRLDDLRGKTKEYVELLSASEDLAASSLSMFQKQIMALMPLVG